MSATIAPSAIDFIDDYAGAGGSSQGLREAGLQLKQAANHGAKQIETHAANFPAADHLLTDLMVCNMARRPRATLSWASPECFTAGHLITTLHRGQVPIEDVVVGDLVLTHMGRWRPVVRVQSREADTIVVKGQGHPGIEVTATHKFWARSSARTWKNEVRDYRRAYGTPVWAEVGSLVQSESLWATPVSFDESRSNACRTPPEVFGSGSAAWWLIGRWVGDGSLSFGRNAEVVVSCSFAEADELAPLLDATGVNWKADLKRTAVNFRIGHRGARDWLDSEFGHGARGKQFPTWALLLPREHRAALLNGYMAADGHSAKRHDQASTVSKKLAISTRLLAESLGHRSGITMDKRTAYRIEGRTGAALPQWSVFWQRNHSEARSPEAFEDGIHAWSRVRQILPGRMGATVYNIEVAEDHSYVLDGIVVANCTWHSPAGGRKRKRQQLDMFDDYVPDEQGERSRLTMMQVIAFAEAKRPVVVIVENVVEVADWELFETWLHGMGSLGYEHQILSVSAAHIWSEANTPAPQWRDRVYFVFYRRGIAFPDVSPRPWALCPECGPVRARQSWKRTDRRRIGKYRAQYVYVCPSPNHSTLTVEPYVAPAMDALDLTDLGTRIADRPLRTFKDKKTGEEYRDYVARATSRRIKVGAIMFGGEPEIVKTSGHTWDAAWPGHRAHGSSDGYYRVQGTTGPLVARTSTPGDAVVSPFMTSTNHGAGDHGRTFDPALFPMPTRSTKLGEGLVTPQPFVTEYYGTGNAKPVDEPLGTVSTREHHALVSSPYAIILRNNAQPELLDAAPMPTLTAGGNHHGIIVPAGAFLSKHHGGTDYRRIEHMNKPLTGPLPTMVASPNVSLIVPPAKRPKLDLSMDEIDRIDISDFRFRMLQWREHANAQRFPRDYIFTGNNSENTLMAGNAVAANVAHYLGILTRIALGDLPFDVAHNQYGLAA